MNYALCEELGRRDSSAGVVMNTRLISDGSQSMMNRRGMELAEAQLAYQNGYVMDSAEEKMRRILEVVQVPHPDIAGQVYEDVLDGIRMGLDGHQVPIDTVLHPVILAVLTLFSAYYTPEEIAKKMTGLAFKMSTVLGNKEFCDE
jgi:hypothetical protein